MLCVKSIRSISLFFLLSAFFLFLFSPSIILFSNLLFTFKLVLLYPFLLLLCEPYLCCLFLPLVLPLTSCPLLFLLICNFCFIYQGLNPTLEKLILFLHIQDPPVQTHLATLQQVTLHLTYLSSRSSISPSTNLFISFLDIHSSSALTHSLPHTALIISLAKPSELQLLAFLHHSAGPSSL